MLRGNTASGKTTVANTHDEFEDAVNPATSKLDGSINVDTYKAVLRKDLKSIDCQVSHVQVHHEGATIKRSIYSLSIESQNLSLVLDERFTYFRNVALVMKDAERTDRLVKLMDLDVPLETSVMRVLGRDVDGEDPLVGFEIVADGFRGIREGRKGVIDLINKNERVTYYLLAETSSFPVEEVVEKKDAVFYKYNELLFDKLLTYDRNEVEKLAGKVVDQDYVQYIMNEVITDKYPDIVRERVRKKLIDNIGKTVKEIINL